LVPPVAPSPSSERTTRPEELDLFAAIRAESPDWQRRAFDEFHGLVFGLLSRSLGPQAEIEDLVSDVFVSFFESAKNIRSADGLRSYVVTITLNTVRREVRQRKRRALFYKLSGATDEIERRPGYDDPKAKAALIQLSRILDQVSTEDRIAFVLHSLAGMQLAEIAEILGVSLSTAKRRVRRATEHVLKRVSRNVLLSDYLREKSERDHD
jgi:RNA polymerase sigma-70 factor (ECF subfamily)